MKSTIHLPVMVCRPFGATVILTTEEHKQLEAMSEEERDAYMQQSYWKRRYELERSKRQRSASADNGVVSAGKSTDVADGRAVGGNE